MLMSRFTMMDTVAMSNRPLPPEASRDLRLDSFPDGFRLANGTVKAVDVDMGPRTAPTERRAVCVRLALRYSARPLLHAILAACESKQFDCCDRSSSSRVRTQESALRGAALLGYDARHTA